MKTLGPVYCTACGRRNGDPRGGYPDDLGGWLCGYCGRGPLLRVRPDESPWMVWVVILLVFFASMLWGRAFKTR